MGAVFAIFSGFYYWFGKITGYLYSETLGKIHFWLTFIGVNVTFFPMHFLGLSGMPRRIPDYPDMYAKLNLLCSIGSLISFSGVILWFFIIFWAYYKKEVCPKNPWQFYSCWYLLIERLFDISLYIGNRTNMFLSPNKNNKYLDKIDSFFQKTCVNVVFHPKNYKVDTLEWVLESPPQLHTFVVSPMIFSTVSSFSFDVKKNNLRYFFYRYMPSYLFFNNSFLSSLMFNTYGYYNRFLFNFDINSSFSKSNNNSHFYLYVKKYISFTTVHMFYNSKYEDTNITLDVTYKSNYLEEYNKEIDDNVRYRPHYSSYNKKNHSHRRNYSTNIRPFQSIYNKGLFLVIKETSSFLILRPLNYSSLLSDSIRAEDGEKTLIIYFNNHSKKKGSFTLSECVFFQKTHHTMNNISSVICVNDHNISSISERDYDGNILLEDIIIYGQDLNKIIKEDFFIDIVFLYDKVYRNDFKFFYSSEIKKIEPSFYKSFYLRTLNFFETKLLFPFLVFSYGVIVRIFLYKTCGNPILTDITLATPISDTPCDKQIFSRIVIFMVDEEDIIVKSQVVNNPGLEIHAILEHYNNNKNKYYSMNAVGLPGTNVNTDTGILYRLTYRFIKDETLVDFFFGASTHSKEIHGGSDGSFTFFSKDGTKFTETVEFKSKTRTNGQTISTKSLSLFKYNTNWVQFLISEELKDSIKNKSNDDITNFTNFAEVAACEDTNFKKDLLTEINEESRRSKLNLSSRDLSLATSKGRNSSEVPKHLLKIAESIDLKKIDSKSNSLIVKYICTFLSSTQSDIFEEAFKSLKNSGEYAKVFENRPGDHALTGKPTQIHCVEGSSNFDYARDILANKNNVRSRFDHISDRSLKFLGSKNHRYTKVLEEKALISKGANLSKSLVFRMGVSNSVSATKLHVQLNACIKCLKWMLKYK